MRAHLAAGAALLTLAACGSASTTSSPAPTSGGVASAAAGPTSSSSGSLSLALGPSFSNGAFLKSSTCDDAAHDFSPGLTFTSAAGTPALAVTMVDLDNGKVHWIQIGLPGDAKGLEEHTLTPGATEPVNDFNEGTYDGPCPPAGTTHRYGITLYAVPSGVDLSAASTPTARVAALVAQATDKVQVVATYTRA